MGGTSPVERQKALLFMLDSKSQREPVHSDNLYILKSKSISNYGCLEVQHAAFTNSHSIALTESMCSRPSAPGPFHFS